RRGHGHAAQRQRAGRPRGPRQPAARLELADLPAAVHQRRADRRLRHHHGTLRVRRARAHARGDAGRVSTPAAAAGAPAALAGRVVLVTGAHGGLGAAAAHACARAGATVVLLGRKVPKLNRVYDAIARDPAELPEPVNYPFDLAGAQYADHEELAERIGARLGRLDGILHCAADFPGLTPLEHADPGHF